MILHKSFLKISLRSGLCFVKQIYFLFPGLLLSHSPLPISFHNVLVSSVAITKFHGLSDLNTNIYFSHSGGWEVQEQDVDTSVPGKGLLPDLQTTAFSLCVTWQREREGVVISLPLLIRILILSQRPHPQDLI